MTLHKPAVTTLFVQQTGVALCYVILAKLVLSFYSANGMVSILWPASGLALAAILLGGTRFWIGIFAGALISALFIHPSINSLLIAAGATLEPLLGGWLLRRATRFDIDLVTPRDYFLLLFISFVAPSICAVTGTTSLLLEGYINLNSAVNLPPA